MCSVFPLLSKAEYFWCDGRLLVPIRPADPKPIWMSDLPCYCELRITDGLLMIHPQRKCDTLFVATGAGFTSRVQFGGRSRHGRLGEAKRRKTARSCHTSYAKGSSSLAFVTSATSQWTRSEMLPNLFLPASIAVYETSKKVMFSRVSKAMPQIGQLPGCCAGFDRTMR